MTSQIKSWSLVKNQLTWWQPKGDRPADMK
jgi:hypothetical protein